MTSLRNQSWIVIASLVIASGCSSMTTSLPKLTAKPKAEPAIVDVLALWQPGEGRDKNGLPTRGFAGQVFFFAAGSRDPVSVTGDVTVVVFDDQGTLEEQKKPIHEFTFKQGIWRNFEQKTNLGPAYQVFIPYSRLGDHQAICSLRVKYEAPDGSGQLALSESASVVLSGSIPEPTVTPQSLAKRIVPGLKTERLAMGRQVGNQTEWPKNEPVRQVSFESTATGHGINVRHALEEFEPRGRASESKYPAVKHDTFSLQSPGRKSRSKTSTSRAKVYSVPLD